ncbi:MAG: GGDEF domain-containing protein [Kangiellaceae bacterium]|jgi:diguanylate cyclase (GGDEF)-like protein|nr:GGDEF domain-containing protein [Kangiellaceae bacterium]
MTFSDKQTLVDVDRLEQENRKLKSILNSLIEKAGQNQATLQRFQSLEFDLLSIEGLPALFDELTKHFKEKLKLSAANLVLHDPYGTTQDLLSEIYPTAAVSDVEFVDNTSSLDAIYKNDYKVQLHRRSDRLADILFDNDVTVETFALLPLVRQNSLIGSYHLASPFIDRFTPEMGSDFYHHLSQVISVCIENTINSDRLKHLSLIDPLTGTKNRRCLYQAMSKEIARAKRNAQPISCLFIDVDHFKKINDVHGHATGDIALKYIAKMIQPNLRASDLLARFGGEEFTAILPNCDRSVADTIAERIRSVIEQQQLISKQDQEFSVTCSVGGTTWDPRDIDADDDVIADKLLKCSDEAVYQAKTNGRNRCVWRPFIID